MSRYLLDTNAVSNLMREPAGPVGRRIRDVGGRAIYTSVIVAAEIRFGLAKSAASNLARRLDDLLSELSVEPFQEPMDQIYGQLRADLERRGTPIGANDLWIATQALHDGSVLVTDNMREFGRVPSLVVENWLRP